MASVSILGWRVARLGAGATIFFVACSGGPPGSGGTGGPGAEGGNGGIAAGSGGAAGIGGGAGTAGGAGGAAGAAGASGNGGASGVGGNAGDGGGGAGGSAGTGGLAGVGGMAGSGGTAGTGGVGGPPGCGPASLDWYPDCDGDGLFAQNLTRAALEPSPEYAGCIDGLPPDGGWSNLVPIPIDCLDDAVFVGECEQTLFRGPSTDMATRGDATGGKWIGTEGALYYLDDGGTSAVALDDTWMRFDRTTVSAPSSLLPAITEDNGLWLTGRSLTYFHHGGTPLDRLDDVWLTLIPPGNPLTQWTNAIAIDDAGKLWIATTQGAAYLNDRGTRVDPCDDTLVWLDGSGAPTSDVRAVLIEGEAGVWFGSEDGLYYLDDASTPENTADDVWTRFDTNDGLVSNRVRGLARDLSGSGSGSGIWLATPSGAVFLDPNSTPTNKSDDSLTIYTNADGLLLNAIEIVLPDPAAGLWFNNFGLGYLDDSQTPAIKSDDTWASWYDSLSPFNWDDVVGDLWLDDEGHPWAAAPSLLRWLDHQGTRANPADDTWHTVSMPNEPAHSQIEAMAIDSMGRKWLAHWPGGVGCFDDGGTPTDPSDDRWARFSVEVGVAELLNTIAIDSSGGVWVGFNDFFTGDAVSYLDHRGTPFDPSDDAWTSFGVSDGLQGGNVLSITVDAANGKWFAHNNGVNYLDDGGTPLDKLDDEWTYFTLADGLGNDYVNHITIDPSGGKWMVSISVLSGSGVSYLDDGGTPSSKLDDTWVVFTVSDGLGSDSSSMVAIDDVGGKWFVDLDVVSYLNDGGTPLNKADDQWTVFDSSDGLPPDGYFFSILSLSTTQVLIGRLEGLREGELTILDHNGTPADKTDDQWATFRPWDPVPAGGIAALVRDSTGAAWIGASHGLGYLRLP